MRTTTTTTTTQGLRAAVLSGALAFTARAVGMCCTPTRNNKRHLPRRATRLSVSLRWPARAKTGKTASALRISDLRSTDSMCSSSSATWNDVRFELKHRARMGAT